MCGLRMFVCALPAPPALTMEQQAVFSALAKGHSCFITGYAGSGKTHVVRAFFSYMMHRYPHRNHTFFYCGMTGSISSNMDGFGQTLHHAFGLPVECHVGGAELHPSKWIEIISKKSRARANFCNCKLLVIEECSFLKKSQLRNFLSVAKHFRPHEAHLPFSGIQIIMVGDYLQLLTYYRFDLPFYDYAYSGTNELNIVKDGRGERLISEPWRYLTVFMLRDVHRHSGDLLRACNNLRTGGANSMQLDRKEWQWTVEYLESLSADKQWSDKLVKPSCLYALREEAEKHNADELRSLPGAVREFVSRDTLYDGMTVAEMSELTNLPAIFRAKVGMPIIFLANDAVHFLVNGSQGTVVDFKLKSEYPSSSCIGYFYEIDKEYPLVRFASSTCFLIGSVSYRAEPIFTARPNISNRDQLPLVAAWAITLHKSQGMSIDNLIVNVSSLTGGRSHRGWCGVVYTAISRAKTADSLQILNFKREQITKQASKEGHCDDAATYYREVVDPDPRRTSRFTNYPKLRSRPPY